MKFEKRLKTETIPEWMTRYIDYKGLKTRLHHIQRAKLAREREWTRSNDQRRSMNSFDDTPSQTEEVISVSNYNDNRYSFQSQRMFSMPEHKVSNSRRPSQIHDMRSVQSQPRTFSMVSSVADSVHDFIHRVSSALVSIQKQQNISDRIPPPDQITSLATLMDQVYPEESTFFEALENELKKVEKFYGEREKLALDRIDVLEQQYNLLKEMKNNEKKKVRRRSTWNPISSRKSKTFSKQGINFNNLGNDYDSTIILESNILELPENQLVNYKVAKKLIRKAVFEFYRNLELLKKYKSLNYTGFVKILKKYDKISERNGTKIYMPKVENSHFVKSNVIKKLLKDAEDFYVNHFEGGSRSQALRKLRLPDRHSKTYYSSMLRVGLYLGLALSALLFSFLITKGQNTPPISLEIYSAFSLPIIFLLLIGINMLVWTQSNINYKFIFEFNPRENLDFRQYLEFPAMILMVISYIMLLDFENFFFDKYQHLYLAIFICTVVLNPFHIFYYNARRWFILSMARLLGSPVLRVEFRDFFIADGLTSLTYSLSMMALFSCLGQGDQEDHECPTSTILTPIFASLPASIRLLQSYKRYRDTHQNNHLINIGKYGVIIMATWMYYESHKSTSYDPLFTTLWIVVQSITSVYTFLWDVKMDWSLFDLHSGNYLLRSELGYKYTWLYYSAIISNLLLRWSWVIVKIYPSKKCAFFVALGEIFRRCLWNFFRVENEHTSNVSKCRAIKEHHLPFKTKIDDEDQDLGTIIPDEDVDLDNSDFDRASSFSTWSRKIFTTQGVRRRKSNAANNWKDFEPMQDASEYIYPDDIYEESDESFDGEDHDDYYSNESKYASPHRGHGLSNAYASRSFPPM